MINPHPSSAQREQFWSLRRADGSGILLLMEQARIAELLRLYIGREELSREQLSQISTYVDLLLKWNARMNLTAVREPEEIIRRHFGESLFAARQLVAPDSIIQAADVGSGAGFPGVPMKIYAPGLRMTLIEAHGKKATFLREVCRTIGLTDIDIFIGRAEHFEKKAELVTLRAVERFESVLPIAATLASKNGRLAVLIGAAQAKTAEFLVAQGTWSEPIPIPESRERVLKVWQNH